MLYNIIKAYFAIVSNFHKPFGPALTFGGIIFLRFLVSAGMISDIIFFPSLRNQKINKPVVIVGNPRSGTTFLQRFLVNGKIGSGMQLWKMLFPSLTLQKFIKPLIPRLEKVSPARFHIHAAHETNLTAIETDDPALLFKYFDGFFVYGFFLAFAKKDYLSRFDPSLRDTSKRDFKWLEKVWKRNLVSENSSLIIPKLFSLGARLPKFLAHFTDAKILYTIRDPLETVPSGLSLVTGVLDGRFGFWKLPEEKRERFINRLYNAFLELSMRFHDDYIAGRIPKDKIMIVRYDRLMFDFENLMNEVLQFIDYKASPELKENIHNTFEKQKVRKSGHKYSLSQFGLTEEKVRKDYDKIYSTFLS